MFWFLSGGHDNPNRDETCNRIKKCYMHYSIRKPCISLYLRVMSLSILFNAWPKIHHQYSPTTHKKPICRSPFANGGPSRSKNVSASLRCSNLRKVKLPHDDVPEFYTKK